jgi:uncharacterized YkwD family protein
MKKRILRKPLLAVALGLAVSGMSTSAFAATYQVQPNDTLNKIAQKTGVPLYKLILANWQIKNPDLIYPGMKIIVPKGKQDNRKHYAPVYQSPAAKAPAKPTPAVQAPAVGSFANEVAALVNQERAKAGLKPLKLDSNLSAMALDKAKDMEKNNYFDHISPTYGSPFDMMDKYGINYAYAGENIAMGQRSPQQVMNDWMNSTGHRQNILNPHYDTIGVAYHNGYWVQEFIGKR